MSNTTYTVIILHGSYGSPDENWFPWLAGQVIKAGHNAITPRLPTPDGQELNTWRSQFMEQVGAIDSHMVLVGHSISAAFILHILQEAPVAAKATFLVSAFTGLLGIEEFDVVNKTFVDGPFDWPRIRQNAGEVYMYSGDNDPYVPLNKGEYIARNLNTQLHVIKDGGHINKSAGFIEFEVLKNDLLQAISA